MDALALAKQSYEEEIETLLAQKQIQIDLLNKLGKSKSKMETMIMEVVNGFTSQI